eukprot:gb/GECH01001756.1/.p1 GENE.gb/GECH01001756.1/~~gb/GECH01001756.1/.p1  ORF type:complete len:788 (+),score=135.98 gb/GECH01001756.1/:1-2364(+)
MIVQDLYPQLWDKEGNKTVYFDQAANALPTAPAIDATCSLWKSAMFANPHSSHTPSNTTAKIIEEVRLKTLKLLNAPAKHYNVIFTTNATHAMRIIGENFFPNSVESTNHLKTDGGFYFLQESAHNSLLGIRPLASSKGYDIHPITITNPSDYHHRKLSHLPKLNSNRDTESHHLFGFPAECNSSGKKYPLDWVKDAKEKGYYVLLDAAKYVSTGTLDLQEAHLPDFVSISYYKIFGLPTGVGALIASKKALHKLRENKISFAGGTVLASAVESEFHKLRQSPACFEEGTISYMDIVALNEVMKTHENISMLNLQHIAQHTHDLACVMAERLNSLQHFNGVKLVEFYGNWSSMIDMKKVTNQGPIISFNLIRSNGQYIGYSEVSKLAVLNNICLRTGCFCNPGACQVACKLTAQEVKMNYDEGHVCWDDKDIMNGKPTGSVRISFGAHNTMEDIEYFIKFLSDNFIVSQPFRSNNSNNQSIEDSKTLSTEKISLHRVILYPLKSCRGLEVKTKWPLGDCGLLFDREWSIIDDNSGRALSQKMEPRLSMIQPHINFDKNRLILSCTNRECTEETISIDLDYIPDKEMQTRVRGQTTQALVYSEDRIIKWLFQVLNRPTHLARKSKTNPRFARHVQNSDQRHKISFSNEAQFLLISRSSTQRLLSKLPPSFQEEQDPILSLEDRFRPNFVISGGDLTAFEEDQWQMINIGDYEFSVAGPCNRCQMICIDQKTLTVSHREPLKTLSTFRRENGKILFGILLSLERGFINQDQSEGEPMYIRVGSWLNVNT